MSLSRPTMAAVAACTALACAGVSGTPARWDAASALIAADNAFAEASSRHDARAAGELIAEDAVFLNRRGLLRGRAAVLEGWKELLTEGGPVLDWTPRQADASDSGELGFTVGDWRLEAKDGSVTTGEYVTVWRRERDGRFRALFDGPLRKGGLDSRSRVAVREARSEAGDLTAEIGTLPAAEGRAEAAYLVVSRSRDGGASRAVETVVPLAPPEP